MIDNPLPDQVMEEYDNNYLSEQFYEHCEDKAKEIAKEFNLLPEFLNDFIEYYADICSESDEGYSLINDKSLIDNWWEKNSYMYDDYDEPYIIFKPQIQKSLPESKHDYCLKCDCILRYDEGNICCSCEEIEDDEPTDDEMMSMFGTKWHDGL